MTNRRTNRIERAPFYTFGACALLVSLFAAYIYFVSASIVHVVIRKEIKSEVAALNSQVAFLEAEYIKQQHAVSNDVAAQKGYVAVAEKVFLTRTDTDLAMSVTR